jgi:hypothetical protein
LFGEDNFGECAARGAFGSSLDALEALLPVKKPGALPLLLARKLASAASRAVLAASIMNCRRVKPGVPGVLLWKMTLDGERRFPRAEAISLADREPVLLALADP